jgi:hypothetical protein
VYKVLLDLMVIKTVASFTARPLLWFTMLALPLLAVGLFAVIYALAIAFGGATLSLPIAGSGLICLAAAIIVIGNGALGELLYKLGDMREHDFSRLTQQVTRGTTTLGSVR